MNCNECLVNEGYLHENHCSRVGTVFIYNYCAKPEVEHVNHPQHYGGESNPFEVIKVCRAWLTAEELTGALKFQIIKYTARAGKKVGQPALQDIQKAAWYSDYLAEFLKEIGK